MTTTPTPEPIRGGEEGQALENEIASATRLDLEDIARSLARIGKEKSSRIAALEQENASLGERMDSLIDESCKEIAALTERAQRAETEAACLKVEKDGAVERSKIILAHKDRWMDRARKAEAERDETNRIFEQACKNVDATNRQLDTAQEEARRLRELLSEARAYVYGAYECAFPDDEANQYLLRRIDEALESAPTPVPAEGEQEKP